MTVTYHAWRAKMGDGSWSVGIEMLDTERPDPDPWGNGPRIVHKICKGIQPDRDWDNDGLASTYRHIDGPPHETNGALDKARRIADRLNSGDLTIDRLRSLLRSV